MRPVRILVPALALATLAAAALAQPESSDPVQRAADAARFCRNMYETTQRDEQLFRTRLGERKAFLYRLVRMDDRIYGREYARVKADYDRIGGQLKAQRAKGELRDWRLDDQHEELRRQLNVMAKSREKLAKSEKLDPANDAYVRDMQFQLDRAQNDLKTYRACGWPEPGAASPSPTPASTPPSSPQTSPSTGAAAPADSSTGTRFRLGQLRQTNPTDAAATEGAFQADRGGGGVPVPQGKTYFSTSKGPLMVDNSAYGIVGTFGHKRGRIEADLTGNVIEGVWSEDNVPRACGVRRLNGTGWGRFRFTFTSTGFSGQWGYCDDPLSLPWSGQRQN